MANQVSSEAGPSREPLHTVSLRIPFHTAHHAHVAKRSLDVDREQNATFVTRSTDVDGADLVIHFTATTVRLLRLATNSFLSSVDLVIRTMEEFAPDPLDKRLTDDELEQERIRANKGGSKGIELKGDGKGAGSGEEIKA